MKLLLNLTPVTPQTYKKYCSMHRGKSCQEFPTLLPLLLLSTMMLVLVHESTSVLLSPSSFSSPSLPSSSSEEEPPSATEWLPVGGIKPTRTWLEIPPNIITSEEVPSVFDITIRHKMGATVVNNQHPNTLINLMAPTSTLHHRPESSFVHHHHSLIEVALTPPSLVSSSDGDDDGDDFSMVGTIISTISSAIPLSPPSPTPVVASSSHSPSSSTAAAGGGGNIPPVAIASPPVMTQSLIPTTGRASPVSEVEEVEGETSSFSRRNRGEQHQQQHPHTRITPSLASSSYSPGMISSSNINNNNMFNTRHPGFSPNISTHATRVAEKEEGGGATHRIVNDTDSKDAGKGRDDGIIMDEDIIYGKPLQSNWPIAPSLPEVTVVGSGATANATTKLTMTISSSSSSTTSMTHVTSTTTTTTTQMRAPDNPLLTPQPSKTQSSTFYRTPAASIAPLGHPVVVPVDMDEVKPKAGPSTSQPTVLTDPGQGSVFIDGRPTHYKIRPVNPTPSTSLRLPNLHVESGMTIRQSPQSPSPDSRTHSIRGHGASSPSSGSSSSSSAPSSLPSSNPKNHPSVRRAPFRPRPVVPLVRIDTCIVGDDSTCDVKMNERCKTELGISSCQCRPGFGRTTPRGMCHPVITLAVALRLDKLGENKLNFHRDYMNPNSETYQLLEFEATQGLNSMFALSRLAKEFMGVKINKFYAVSGKMLVNASIELEQNNMTRNSGIRRVVQQELTRVIALRNYNIGDSTLSVESTATSVPRVEDVNECQSTELNDCSPNALCYNDFGSFRCVCKKGYDDRHPSDSKRSGRVCSSCSPAYCGNRGECHVVNGERECQCRGNFIGAKCDIDVEVLGVAVGGSVAALVIIVITFLCLYMWNQKWKAEQLKIEAMSAASVQTFSYMNKQQPFTPSGYRYPIDDRYGWVTQVNDAANFYASSDHVLANTSQQHLYATPKRAPSPTDAVMGSEEIYHHHHHYTRPSRSKSRNSTARGLSNSTNHYQSPNLYAVHRF